MKLRYCVLVLCLCIKLCAHGALSLQSHERWWDENAATMVPQFMQWFGDSSSISRVLVRQHIKRECYKTVLDIPCSLAVDFEGFQQDETFIAYLGMDISPKLVDLAQSKHIPAMQASIENIPCKDSSFEVCYARHILEHHPYYENALRELIRVARFEVIVVFFMAPVEHYDDQFLVSLNDDCLLYYNCYNRSKMNDFLLHHAKVSAIEWQDVDGKEVILRIYLNSDSSGKEN